MPRTSKLPDDFFRNHPVDCARALIGCTLRWDGCAGIIVETEAYCEHGDAACHTFTRPSARAFVAAHPPGSAYVYLNYGMHWLANVLVKSPSGNGFVLIRALEPSAGLDAMRRRRGGDKPDRQLCSGPAKLTQALGIDGQWHGRSLCRSARRGLLAQHGRTASPELVSGPRIGISQATELPWRFHAAGNPHVSR